MKRALSCLLVGLVSFGTAAAPRMAAAQDYGPKPRIISVSSTGSRLNGQPRTEVISVGQTRTSLDHNGPAVQIGVWVPVAAAGARGWLDWSVTLADQQRLWVRDFSAVRLGNKLLGWTISFCTVYYPFTECYCRLQEPYHEAWGDGWSVHHTLLLR